MRVQRKIPAARRHLADDDVRAAVPVHIRQDQAVRAVEIGVERAILPKTTELPRIAFEDAQPGMRYLRFRRHDLQLAIAVEIAQSRLRHAAPPVFIPTAVSVKRPGLPQGVLRALRPVHPANHIRAPMPGDVADGHSGLWCIRGEGPYLMARPGSLGMCGDLELDEAM